MRTGFYYVNAAAGCSDGQANGFPGAARCTIPSSLPAGAYVEVHGTYNTGHTFSWTGTAASPIFITGETYAARPLVTAGWSTGSASYVVLENLHFGPLNSSDSSFGFSISEGAHHVALRSAELSGNTNQAGGLSIGAWGYGGTAAVSQIVIKNVNIHNLGVIAGATGDRDIHCVTVNGTVNNLWIVDSTFSACEGDGIQIEAQHGRGLDKINHIYYARNVTFGHKQAGIGVKHSTDVIVSQNKIYNIAQSSSAPGACVGSLYNPQYVWFLFNEVHDCEIGFYMGGDDGADGTENYYIGNLVYKIHHPSNPTNIYDSGSFSLRGGTNSYIINNTIADFDTALASPPSGGSFHVHNNIVSGRTVAGASELDFQNGTGGSTINNNLFYRASGGLDFTWGSTNATSVPFGGTCTACRIGDPQFVSPGTDFRLRPNSPAIDGGAAHAAYALFQSRYGVSIAYDFNGAPRPLGAWDIGAFEGGGIPGPPGAPTNLRILQ